MNKESNKYIFLYSVVLVFVVSIVLSLAVILLKPFQQKNAEIEKKYNILCAVQKAKDAKTSKNKVVYIEKEYSKYIRENFILNSLGERIDADAFLVDLSVESAKSVTERQFPVFICTEDDSSRKIIIPLRGSGLWGAIWGYIALQQDYNTICGVVFDHKSETPGLGAEIATKHFQDQFIGKQLFNGENFVSIKLLKGGSKRRSLNEVDAISGGTITGQGLELMLESVLKNYLLFFRQQQTAQLLLEQSIEKKDQEKLLQYKETTLVNPNKSSVHVKEHVSQAEIDLEQNKLTEEVLVEVEPSLF
ncbi:MAG: NADH:ubiquinone reductase (Na(+)-transporting) subunit C [Bacteroidales bacterium]